MATFDVLHEGRVFAWTRGVQFEDEARQQVANVASLPFVRRVAVMPDVHWGRGATVGTVLATKGAVIPAAVGVDIGCGMVAACTSLTANHLPDSLAALRSEIERMVPHGRTDNGGAGDRGAWHDIPDDVAVAWGALLQRYEVVCAKHPKARHGRSVNHVGTLGTGNHFIEICLDEAERVWVMLHSGSRGPGNKIGSYFTELAKEEMRRWMINLPDADLAYLPEGTEHYDDYVQAVSWAQEYARLNRDVMLARVLSALATIHPLGLVEAAINCHHNYVAMENHLNANMLVTRKGAVRAREGDLGIIPGSMGARSYIVRGKGSRDSLHSCSHGAGRAMSRGKAKKTFTLEDHEKATAHVECRKDIDVIDETPGAYKPIDAVMEAQADLVDVVHTLRQVVCVKG